VVERIRILLSMAFLVAALLLFVAFHFLWGFGNDEPGWHSWIDVGQAFRNPSEFLDDPNRAVAIVSFLTFSLLILASPFLTPVWTKSRLGWWIAVVFSALAAGAFWVMIFTRGSHQSLGPGGFCLVMAPMLNVAGLLLARKSP
jgi:hypothetical protein